MKNRIRVESDQNVVTNAKIFFVPEEGDEVDISKCVTGVDLHLHVGEASRATLHVILVDGYVTAGVDDVIVKHLNQKRFRRIRNWRRRVVASLKRKIARSLEPELRREIVHEWPKARA